MLHSFSTLGKGEEAVQHHSDMRCCYFAECQYSPLGLFEIFAEKLLYFVEGDYFQIIIQIYVVGTGNNL